MSTKKIPSYSDFRKWFVKNEDYLRDMWEVMGTVERFEEGGSFTAFCHNRYLGFAHDTP